MFRSLHKEERGYSLIEVMVSIMILTIAILPMVSMFDMGLNSATAGSQYDKARALANLKLEEAKSLPFSDVENNFPLAAGDPGIPTPYDGWGLYQSDWMTEAGPANADFTNFHYRVDKQYMAQPSKTPDSSSENFVPCDQTSTDPDIACSPGTNLIRVTVTVGWGEYTPLTDTYSKTYTTFGLVTG